MSTGFFSLLHIIAVASITTICLWILIRQRRIHRSLKTSAAAGENPRLRRQSRWVLMVGLTALAVVLASRITPLLVGSGEMEGRHPENSPVNEASALPSASSRGREIRVKIKPVPEASREAPAKPQSDPQPAEPIAETSPLKPEEPAVQYSVTPAVPVAQVDPPKAAEPAVETSLPKKPEAGAQVPPLKTVEAPPHGMESETQDPLAAAPREAKSVHPYTIHVSSHLAREEAVQAALKFTADGDFAFTSPATIPGKGDWHRVFIGFYRNRQEAQSAAKRLKVRKYPYAMVLRQPYALQVGLLASEGELARARSGLEKEGLIPYLIPESGSRRLRLLVGSFKTADTAERLKNRLEKEGIRSRVVFR